MKNLKFFFLIFLTGYTICNKAYAGNFNLDFSKTTILLEIEKEDLISVGDTTTRQDTIQRTKNKLIAIALTLTLGPFGVHRLYLGTAPKVPIAYTLTLGGGFFVLPLIDIFYIIANRDSEMIENNNHLFIWNKKRNTN